MIGLLRIGTVALLWAEWLAPIRPVHHLAHPEGFLLGMAVLLPSLGLFVGWRTTVMALLTAIGGFGFWLFGAGLDAPTASIEGWLLIGLCLCLAAMPAGSRFAVDVAVGNPSVDRGGAVGLRWLWTGFFAAAALHHASAVWLLGARIEQLFLVHYGIEVGPASARMLLAGLVLAIEVVVAVAPWLGDRGRPVLLGSFALLVLGYPVLHLGTLTGILGLLLLGQLFSDTTAPRDGAIPATPQEAS